MITIATPKTKNTKALTNMKIVNAVSTVIILTYLLFIFLWRNRIRSKKHKQIKLIQSTTTFTYSTHTITP